MYLAGSSRNEGQSSSTASTAPEGKVVHVLHALMLLNRVCSFTIRGIPAAVPATLDARYTTLSGARANVG